jgi:hypothetical protein
VTDSAKSLDFPHPILPPVRESGKARGATPTLKVKHKHISEVFKDLIEAGYGD